MTNLPRVDIPTLREALEASWDAETSYRAVSEENNPALGQCYPTSRVIQAYFPATEIIEGQVWTGKALEKHFWNLLPCESGDLHIDLTWQQFPHGSIVKSYKIRDRETLGDGPDAIRRVELLLSRVNHYLQSYNQKI